MLASFIIMNNYVFPKSRYVRSKYRSWIFLIIQKYTIYSSQGGSDDYFSTGLDVGGNQNPKIKIEFLKDLKDSILKVTLKVGTFFQFAFKMVVLNLKTKTK